MARWAPSFLQGPANPNGALQTTNSLVLSASIALTLRHITITVRRVILVLGGGRDVGAREEEKREPWGRGKRGECVGIGSRCKSGSFHFLFFPFNEDSPPQ